MQIAEKEAQQRFEAAKEHELTGLRKLYVLQKQELELREWCARAWRAFYAKCRCAEVSELPLV